MLLMLLLLVFLNLNIIFDDTYAALCSASPSETILMHIFAVDSTVTSNCTILAKVKLIYHAVFYDPIVFASS